MTTRPPIEIGNRKDYLFINPNSEKTRYKRGSEAIVYCYGVLGNPYKPTKYKSNSVCIAEYEFRIGEIAFLESRGIIPNEPRVKEIMKLKEIWEKGTFDSGEPISKMVLVCHCYPNYCHAEVIRRIIKGELVPEEILLPWEKQKLLIEYSD